MEGYLRDVKEGTLQQEKIQEGCIQQFDKLLGQLQPYTHAVQRQDTYISHDSLRKFASLVSIISCIKVKILKFATRTRAWSLRVPECR